MDANDIVRVDLFLHFHIFCVPYSQFAVGTLMDDYLGKLHDHVTTDCVLLEG